MSIINKIKKAKVILENIKLESIHSNSKEEDKKIKLCIDWSFELLEIEGKNLVIKALSNVEFDPKDIFTYEAEYRCVFILDIEENEEIDKKEIEENLDIIVNKSSCGPINSLLFAQLSDRAGNFPIVIPPTVLEKKD